MGHTIKGQSPRQYRPSTTRRPSGLSPINESRENAKKRWNRLRAAVMTAAKIQRNIRKKGVAKRGRFTVRDVSPKKKSGGSSSVQMWKNVAPGVYFVTSPYQKGRFTVENIYGKVKWPKTTNQKR